MSTADGGVLVLQHRPWEHPGLIGRALGAYDAAGAMRTLSLIDEPAAELPEPSSLKALVVMGGPMGALDDAEFPGLARERSLIADAVAAGVPTLGVCLGMQLLAVALGGRLNTGSAREIGLAPVSLTGDGLVHPLLYPLAVEATADPDVLHWHGDSVTLPPGATLLAYTERTPVQAFSLGSAIGLQFHLEVTPAHLAQWLAEPEMVDDLSSDELASIKEDGARRLELIVPRALMGLRTFRPRNRPA
ncbi:type 1 glutamine amidotransferase [Rarobacter faecitabidus]|uniref:GMP synthase-like glutamine amidotransferase n=1 Tax=Rarobacter faecitabidus TaxID=13243 RepID=A0A542ZVZ7_RARFA|nr:type 1 glutamine amidotransferase [Rarobacter faecitabidus]TQL64535.1 GMP synthase-like glutamine amidotransferase [Rarobacter faecitabidus]